MVCTNQDCVDKERACTVNGLMPVPKAVCKTHANRYTSVVAEPIQGPNPSAREFVWFGHSNVGGAACSPIALLSFEHKDGAGNTVQFVDSVKRK